MDIVIKQAYWTMNNKFSITDPSGNTVYYGSNKWMKVFANFDLFDKSGILLYHLQSRMMHIGSYFDIWDGEYKSPAAKVIGAIDERKTLAPWKHKAIIKLNGKKMIKIVGGLYSVKAFVKEGNKWDKKNPVVYTKKKIMKIADTYVATIDEKRIDPAIGVLVAIWYDMVAHAGH